MTKLQGFVINNKRDVTLDFAKGLAIILMIYDHIVGTGKVITSFHMPLFFIISGYLLREEELGTCLRRKAKGLLIPYVIYTFVAAVVGVFKMRLYLGESAADTARYFFTKVGNIFLGKDIWLFWFVLVLFEATILYALIQKIFRSEALRWVASIVVFLGGYLLSQQTGNETPYYIDLGLFAVLFLRVGDAAKRLPEYLQEKKTLRAVLFFLALIVWIFGIHYGLFAMAIRIFYGFPLCVISAITGTYVVIVSSNYLHKIPAVGTYVIWCGQSTLQILCMGNLFRQFTDWAAICRSVGIESYAMMFMIQMGIITAVVWAWRNISAAMKR